MYLFIYLSALVLSCGKQDLHCGMWEPSWWHAAFSVPGLQWLWLTDYLVVACRPSNFGVWASLPCSMWDLSFLTRDQTQISCIGQWILNHWTTRAVPSTFILYYKTSNILLVEFFGIYLWSASSLLLFMCKWQLSLEL